MENVAREQGLALHQLFPYRSSYFFKKNSDRQKISFFNDGGLKLAQHSPEYIENTKMVKFEAPGIKSKFIRQFEFSENVEDLYGKRCSPSTFPIQVFLFFLKKNSDRQKVSFFNDGALKLSHFDIFDMLFPFLAFVNL